jgi:hypothetical protein
MALGIHILAYVTPMDAGPFGATLLTVRLNPARGCPWTPKCAALSLLIFKRHTTQYNSSQSHD